MNDFPILERKIRGKRLVYLDNASTSQKPQQVLDAMNDFYTQHNANIHRGIYTLSEESTKIYEETRTKIANFLNVPTNQIIYTSGTTESINFVAHSWGLFNLQEGDEILMTPLEHHANILPWQHIATIVKAKIVHCALQDDFTLDIEDLKSKITERTKVLCLIHVSNVLGIATPVKELIQYAKAKGVTVVIDGAQAVPHMKVDLSELQPDFYCFSSHKMLGPTGMGILYMDAAHMNIEPYKTGGDMINDVWDDHAEFAQNEPRRFEAGTPNTAGVVGLGAAVDYLEKRGMENVHAHETELLTYCWNALKKIEGVTLYGPNPEDDPLLHERAAVISFNVAGVHPHDVAQILDEQGIAIRSGQHCAHPLMRRLGVQATNRASFYLYNTKEDVDALVEGIKHVQEVFR